MCVRAGSGSVREASYLLVELPLHGRHLAEDEGLGLGGQRLLHIGLEAAEHEGTQDLVQLEEEKEEGG